MADLLDNAVTWLAGQAKASMARTITYIRGAQAGGVQSATFPATLGSSLLKLSTDYDERLVRTQADFVFTAADLVLGGLQTVPQHGDQIRAAFFGITLTFEVQGPGGEPAWRYADAHQTMIRVHCRRLA